MTEVSPPKKKLVIGLFSFTCCEGCSILLTEILNDYLEAWLPLVEFRHAKALKTNNRLEGLDLAIIEGAISSVSKEEELKEIRANSKYVLAIGSCAVTGLPSASRNTFEQEGKIDDRIRDYFNRFDYAPQVKKLEDVIKVDDKVPGCPMNKDLFLAGVNKYLKICGIVE
ncbi:hypothetical protein COX08_01850 [Candidatus Beckwithbacteria bacterium CG23_combo_of_CG06-09_8_20_14_all_34_8]|uniref:NADH:ubiquinone oxidoreductase-like 20kDa subunit domain-containing protein n=1 Tax=Candidatus Beckwithbacteria bacterium CG23_combo_of_CG06-09_8_20_14_all_34_8 TaxID=1974497 RepID=A0A2H0B6H0_9BACT|nr:MAG: hypothetical protein COX08_01850 [Candidatus Beckwithbacteria bacterium CG23_combo_of_CG06-09_8_20_14_all_34_8]